MKLNALIVPVEITQIITQIHQGNKWNPSSEKSNKMEANCIAIRILLLNGEMSSMKLTKLIITKPAKNIG
jgi:hypothetical protein